METVTTATDTTTPAAEAPKADPKRYESQRYKSQTSFDNREKAKAASDLATKATSSEVEKEVDGSKETPSVDVREILGKKKESDTPEVEGEKKEAKVEKEPAFFKEKVKAKIDGQEVEVTVSDLLKSYQKGQSADKKFQEAASVKKQASQLIKLLQTDPLAVLKHPALGHKAEAIRELMEKELYEYVKLEAMDPKDRELHELKHKMKVYEDDKRREAEEASENEIKTLAEKYTTDYQKQIVDALEMGGLPKSPYTVKQMAYYMRQALDKGHRLRAVDVVDLVKEDFQKMFGDLYGTADGDKLIALFGDDVAEKINKARLKKLQATPGKMEIGEETGEKKKPALSWEDWRQRNRVKNK